MALIKSAATVGGYTLVSRALGFIRDMLTAAAVGTGPVAQAFVIAFRFPNLFRALFAEGAFNSAFVPMYARRVGSGGEAAARTFCEEIFAALFAWLLLFTVLAELAMPVLMYAIAPGFGDEPITFDLSVAMTRIAFPYLLLMSLTAFLSGILNSLRRFAAAAAAPILLNVIMIVTLLAVHALGWRDEPATGFALVWGVFFAGIAQFALLWMACRSEGVRLRLRWPRLTPDVRVLVNRGLPGVISGGITQVNLLIATMIATTIDRAVSYLYYADRIYQLPLGVVGVAIGVVLLPDMSRKLGAGDEKAAMASQNRALELAMFLTFPATIALMAIPLAVINVCFERGAFTANDSLATATALAAFAAGLPAFVFNKVLLPGYFAREDTQSPMRFAIVSVIVNIALSFLLSHYIGHTGIALATAIAAWVNASQLGIVLSRRGHFVPDGRLKQRLLRIVLSGLAMGAVLLGSMMWLGDLFVGDAPLALRAGGLGLLVALGIGVYFGLAHVTGAMTIGEFRRLFGR